MAFHVRNQEADRLVRELARRTGLSMSDAVRVATAEKLARLEADEANRDRRPFLERIKDIQDRVAARGKSGLKADKAFYDSLYED